jgi:hypothetical protein
MQTSSAKAIDILYKSCSVFHQEFNKIEFAFFCFYTILYEFSKNQQICFTIGESIFEQAPGQFPNFTDIPLDHRLAPRKIKNFVMRPLAMGRRRLAGIPTVPTALPAREEVGEVRELT